MQTHDEHNARLIELVHPPDWVNPTPTGRYNLVVIGAGTAGLVTAAGAAGLGAKVALIERHLMGGDCLNVGCVPSKALISAARAAASVRRAGELDFSKAPLSPEDGGEGTGRATVNAHSAFRTPHSALDFPRIMDRLRRLRADIAPNDSATRFKSLGVDVFLGEGRFTGLDTIEVAGQTLRFKTAVIATGARATRPETPGLADVGYLTNETVFELSSLPPRMAIVGGGPIGCELAQAFARLGSQVTLIEQSHQLLGREDKDAARLVQESLERDGVRVLLNTVVEYVASEMSSPVPSPPSSGERARVRGPSSKETLLTLAVSSPAAQPSTLDPQAASESPPNPLPSKAGGEGTGSKTLFVKQGGETIEVTADEILVAAGRTPNLEGLNLEAVGVQTTSRGVVVDDRLRTTNQQIFAAGDVCSPFKFTHAADFMARIVIQNALFFGRAKASSLVIPWCTYTSPEVAQVGLTELAAAEQGVTVKAFVQDLRHIDRAILEGSTSTAGFVKILVKAGSDQVVGATIVAEHAGEMIGEIVLAITNKIGLGRLAATIHPYPTVAEAIRKCGDDYNRTRLTPFVKRLFQRWLAWTR